MVPGYFIQVIDLATKVKKKDPVVSKTFQERAMGMVDKAIPDLSELNKARFQTGMDGVATAGHAVWMSAKAGATAMIGIGTGSAFMANWVGAAVSIPMAGATWGMGKSTINSFNDMLDSGKATVGSFREMKRLSAEHTAPIEGAPAEVAPIEGAPAEVAPTKAKAKARPTRKKTTPRKKK